MTRRERPAPCPFCGYRDVDVCHGPGWAWCECERCGATGPWGERAGEAIGKWNTLKEER